MAMHDGQVVWDAKKSLWFGGITVAAAVLGPLTFSPRAFAVFVALTSVTLCCGHSVGIHRGIVHRSYRVPKWLEYTLAYLGVLVGLGGVRGLVRLHEARDREQNEAECHDYFAHRRLPFVDYFWNLHCRFEFSEPVAERHPRPDIENDAFYGFLERTWRFQQLPLAVVLFALGGWPFVVWGVLVRVAVSTTGHWFVGHVCHRTGTRRFTNRGSAVQGWNSAWLGALSMGEGWHNNHHAFPRSARLGLEAWEIDPGWYLLMALRALGLATHVLTPADQVARAETVEALAPHCLASR